MNDVFQCTKQVIEEIEILRDAIGVSDVPIDPEPQSGKASIQVYGKGLEVMEKLALAERKLGLAPVAVKQLPIKELIPQDILGLCRELLTGVDKMKQQLAIEEKSEEFRFVGGKTPSHV